MIRLDDLRRFNQDRKFGLDPIALALYGCMLSLNVTYPSSIYEGVTFEVILDKFTKATSKIKKARQYAASAKRDDVSRNVMVTPLMGGLSFKNVLPMQAADFLAYEVLKFNGAKIATWSVGNEAPVRRKSFDILWDAAAVDGSVWDYAWLNQITAYRGGVW